MSPASIQKSFVAILLGLVLSTAAAASETPDELVQAAWKSNPTLEVLENNIEAALYRIPQAGAWKDPVFALEYSNVPLDSFELGDHAMSGVQLKIQQNLPFPGKTSKRRKQARINAEAAQFEKMEKRNQLRGMVKNAYWQLAESRILGRMIREQIVQVQELIGSVKSRYEIGAASQHELLKLEVLRDRLNDEAADFHRLDVELTAAINSMLHRAIETRIETAVDIVALAPENSVEFYSKQAESAHPALQRLSKTALAAQAAAKRAQYEKWPDPTLWAGYRFREEVVNAQGMVMDEGDDFISIGLAIPAPLFYKQHWGAAKKQSGAESRAAKASRSALMDNIRSDIAKTLAAWQRAEEKFLNYKNTIEPGQHRAVIATRAAWEVGRASFASLYDSQVSLINVRQTLIKSAAQTRILEAKMESLVGKGVQEKSEDPS
jgi:outer membrane protein, heavy metal efflux system